MSENISKNSEVRNKKGGKVALVICIVAIITLLGVVIYLLLKNGESDNSTKRNVVVNKQNVEEVISQLTENEKVSGGSYQVTMNGTWNFANGAAASDNAYVENAAANVNSVYFDITRNDTDETIYESPILPVGSHLKEITLDTELPAGTYDCVMKYQLLADDDESVISSVKVNLTIVIEQ